MLTTSIRTFLFPGTAAFLLAGLAAGCGGGGDATPEVTEPVRTPPPAQATTVTGCLKGGEAAGSYVLVTEPAEMGAEVERATRGQVTTYTYALEGQNLESHVGRVVSITGAVADGDDVEVEESREQTAPPTTVDGETVTPTVEVEEKAVIDVRRMRVDSVQPTGEACTAAQMAPATPIP